MMKKEYPEFYNGDSGAIIIGEDDVVTVDDFGDEPSDEQLFVEGEMDELEMPEGYDMPIFGMPMMGGGILEEIFNYPCTIEILDFRNHGCETLYFDSIRDAESKFGVSALAIWANLMGDGCLCEDINVNFGAQKEFDEFGQRESENCKDE